MNANEKRTRCIDTADGTRSVPATLAEGLDKAEGRTLRCGFLQSVERTPDAIALVVRDRTWTFGEIDRQARIWAQAIVQSLGRAAFRVGVFASRSEVSYIGPLAALFSGATFVPLNPKFPVERTRAMIGLADLDAILVDRESAAQLAAVLPAESPAPVLILPELEAAPHAELAKGSDRIVRPTQDDAAARGTDNRVRRTTVLGGSELKQVAPLETLPPVIPEQIAYLLFTSGSTGQPKGVPVAHANVLHFIDVMVARYGITGADRFSQTFDQTFDLSVFDVFVAWDRGASVYALQELDLLAPVRFVKKHEITVWFSVPSLPALLRKKGVLKPESMPSLRWSLFCGEPLPQASAEAWQAAAPNSIVENLYGPTELTIACFVHRWDPARSPARCVNDVVPVGRPYPGLAAVVVDDDLRPVSPGEPGELCVCGGQTVPGYWKNPAQTAERFVTLDVRGAEVLRFYRTGDRVQRSDDGEYVYLGRTDHQIKVLGHRVELGEIESVLLRQTGIVQAVAIGWPVHEGTAEGIVSFVCGAGIDTEAIKQAARRALPAYMVPKEVFVIDEMPLNANGKIDRKALQARLQSAGLRKSA